MSVICFASYEIHPTTWGGCGVLLHHAAERLLCAGHDVVFLLDIPHEYFQRFVERDRLGFTNAHRCRAYHVDTLCSDFPYAPDRIPGTAYWKSLRFAHAAEKLRAIEPALDFIEFFEYCGVAYHTLVNQLFAISQCPATIGVRLHNSIELIDTFGSNKLLDEDRYFLYRLEHEALRWSEATLTPTQTYFDHYYRARYGLDPSGVAVSQSPKLEFPRVTSRPRKDEPFRIVYVGRVMQFKGVDQLVRAAVELFNRRPELAATVEFIGPDNHETPFGKSYVAYLRTLIPAPLRNRFAFTGHLDHKAIVDRLSTSLFAVFPNRFESFCYALHEVYDAGVPVIINDLPGLAEFFEHERNALMYDGSVRALTGAMERMIDDDELRERLAKPYEIAQAPLGTYYEKPRRLLPVVQSHDESHAFHSLAIVLCPRGIDDAAARETLDSLRAQSQPFSDVLALTPIKGPEDEAIWWLGHAWRATGAYDDRSRATADLKTGDAIVTLLAGDAPHRTWLENMQRALRRRPGDLAYVLTWAERPGGVDATLLDIAPEIYPFRRGAELTRALIRTRPGESVADVFEVDLGPLGEIGLIWRRIAEGKRGAAMPSPLIRIPTAPAAAVDHALLQSLIVRYGAAFGDRFAIYASLLHEEVGDYRRRLSSASARLNGSMTESKLLPDVSVDYRFKLAGELGGRDLLRMALRKAARRMLGRTTANGTASASPPSTICSDEENRLRKA